MLALKKVGDAGGDRAEANRLGISHSGERPTSERSRSGGNQGYHDVVYYVFFILMRCLYFIISQGLYFPFLS